MLLLTFILENEFYNSENLNNVQLSEEGQVYTYFLQTFTSEECGVLILNEYILNIYFVGIARRCRWRWVCKAMWQMYFDKENVKKLCNDRMNRRMNKWRDEWIEDWMNEWKDEWMEEWMNGRMNKLKNVAMKGWMNERMNQWNSVLLEMWLNWRMNYGRMNEWKNNWIINE